MIKSTIVFSIQAPYEALAVKAGGTEEALHL